MGNSIYRDAKRNGRKMSGCQLLLAVAKGSAEMNGAEGTEKNSM
jgi:hypothetical protein